MYNWIDFGICLVYVYIFEEIRHIGNLWCCWILIALVVFLDFNFWSTVLVIQFVSCFTIYILYITQKQQLKNLCRQILIIFKPYENSLKFNLCHFIFKEIGQSNFQKCISVAFLCDFSIFFTCLTNWYIFQILLRPLCH